MDIIQKNMKQRVKPKSGRYSKKVRLQGYIRKKRYLSPKKKKIIAWDKPISIQIKRDAFGRVIGSRRARK